MRKRKKQYGNQLHARSRITNGHSILPSIDHRTSWARRFRDLVGSFASDLGQDEDALSEGQRALLKHASAMCVELEAMETRFAARGGAELQELNVFQRTVNSLRRVIESLGTHRGRIPRDITDGISLNSLLQADEKHERLAGDDLEDAADDLVEEADTEARMS
jgi:hypothetical protein